MVLILNEKHTVKVEDYFGALLFFKKSRMLPSTFIISGFYEHYTLIQ